MRIKEILRAKNMSVSELAEKMRIKQESLSRSINGNPTKETLENIAKYLEVELWELFTDGKTKNGYDFKCPHCGTELELLEKVKGEEKATQI